jgi:ribosomal protein S18 acetylase RimI-like enzyme
MICPNHKKYFNWKQVEEEGITHCPDCKAKLEKAWNSNEVEEEILKVANSSGFYGFLVMDDKNKIQGFAWAEIMNIQEVLFKWGKEIHSELSDLISSAGSSDNNGEIIYFDELGLSRKYRNKGLGKVLVKRTCQSFSKKFPNTPSFLRTHKNSPAIHIYQKLGYDIVCDDTEFGDGRVILYTPKSKQLNLNF